MREHLCKPAENQDLARGSSWRPRTCRCRGTAQHELLPKNLNKAEVRACKQLPKPPPGGPLASIAHELSLRMSEASSHWLELKHS